MLFEKFCTRLITGLMKNGAGLINLLSFNILTCQGTDNYQKEVFAENYILN